MLPKKKSFSWICVLAGVFTINVVALLMSRVVLSVTVDIVNIMAFAILSLIISGIASMGYFGISVFSYAFIFFNALGLCYMYFVILSNKSDGWLDLASFIGFIFIAGFGIFIGIIAELIYRVIKRNKVK
ncbi:MAG: hypothetical protein CVV02_12550 [Firmicutes bacterium HGW-Firmicutes-7]|nr:MAG: hypothetical protein CVV02_12550 [Firmicutes bacterium HGW-Firmicutes-7]